MGANLASFPYQGNSTRNGIVLVGVVSVPQVIPAMVPGMAVDGRYPRAGTHPAIRGYDAQIHRQDSGVFIGLLIERPYSVTRLKLKSLFQ